MAEKLLRGEQDWPPLPLGRVAGHLRYASHVDSDSGQSAPGLESSFQSLVGGAALCQRPRLTTSPIPYPRETFEVQFDFIDHKLDVLTGGGRTATLRLEPRSVAEFYAQFMDLLHSLGIEVKIWPMPVEVPNPIRFDQDRAHARL